MSVWGEIEKHDRQFARVHEAITILTKTVTVLTEEFDKLRKEVDELKEGKHDQAESPDVGSDDHVVRQAGAEAG